MVLLSNVRADVGEVFGFVGVVVTIVRPAG
jgi:hypothetical protein